MNNESESQLAKPPLVHDAGPVLMEVTILLMSSGANTERVRTTLSRIGQALGLQTEILITHRTIHLHLSTPEQHEVYHHLNQSFAYHTNLDTLSEISVMSWKIVEEEWTLPQIQKALQQIALKPRYPSGIVALMVSLAGAAFCHLFGGNALTMLAAFVATWCGQWIRHRSSKKEFNPYLSTFMAAVAASFVALGVSHFVAGIERELIVPASLLFLIPGIPMINSFSDLIDGNILNGLLRGVHGLLVAFSIAMGFLTSLFLFPIG